MIITPTPQTKEKNNKPSSAGTEFKHPELKKGEILLSNMTREEFDNLTFKTKRRGVISYSKIEEQIATDHTGKEIFPIFVQEKEKRRKNF